HFRHHHCITKDKPCWETGWSAIQNGIPKREHSFARLKKWAAIKFFRLAETIGRRPLAVLTRNPSTFDFQTENSFSRNQHYKINFSVWLLPPAGESQRVQHDPVLCIEIVFQQVEQLALGCAGSRSVKLCRQHFCQVKRIKLS